jgi:hypothetical protein
VSACEEKHVAAKRAASPLIRRASAALIEATREELRLLKALRELQRRSGWGAPGQNELAAWHDRAKLNRIKADRALVEAVAADEGVTL